MNLFRKLHMMCEQVRSAWNNTVKRPEPFQFAPVSTLVISNLFDGSQADYLPHSFFFLAK